MSIRNISKYRTATTANGKRKFNVNANSYNQYYTNGNYSANITQRSSTVAEDDLLDGILINNQPKLIRKIYRDIYYHDSIAGSAVDLMSNMPFSDFTLSGVNDPEILQYYVKSIENMRIKTLLPALSIDYLVMGAFIGTLNFDKNRRIFTNIIPHNMDDCEFTELPVYGMDPLIELSINEELATLHKLKNVDPRVDRLLKSLPANFQRAIQKQGNKVILDPGSTLYIPRRSFSTANLGSSYFERLLPIFILEKALLKGTIEQSQKRIRSVLHIKAGDDEWDPSFDELSHLSNLFTDADADPVSAVVATRNGIDTEEIRQGGDFWKYDDIYDFASGAKLRSLGISESFLTGDATYNNMEVALSVFIEQLRSYRELVTREFFYQKLFPNLAVANNFKKKQATEAYGKVTDKEKAKANDIVWGSPDRTRIVKDACGKFVAICNGDTHHDVHEVDDITQYEIPKLNWHKQLKPEADRDYMDILTELQDRGIPIPLRMLAGAAGQSIEEILDQKTEDLKVREQLDSYSADIENVGNGEEDEARFIKDGDPISSKDAMKKIRELIQPASVKKIGMFNREYGDEYDPYQRDKLGRKKSVSPRRKKEINENTNRLMATVLQEAYEKGKYDTNQQYKEQNNSRIRPTPKTNLKEESKDSPKEDDYLISKNLFGVTEPKEK